MSSSNNPNDRATQILEQQKRVAARLKQQTGSHKRPTSLTTAKGPPSMTHNKTVVDLTASPPTKSSSSNSNKKPGRKNPPPSSSSSAVASQKRPSSFKRPTRAAPQHKRPTTAAAALAQARNRLQAKTSGAASSTTTKTAKKSTSLSQWVSSAASLQSSHDGEESSLLSSARGGSNSGYGQIEPEDFWRNLRDWNLLSSIVQERSENSNRKSEKELENKAKPLPDTFVSHRHYMAAWAPLCLAETRAQLLQEILTQINKQQDNKKLWIPVVVTVGKAGRGGPMSMDYTSNNSGTLLDCISVTVRAKDRHDAAAARLQTFPHDLFLLLPSPHATEVELALKNKSGTLEESFRKYGLVGHAEYMRKSLDGLVLKVSKKWWAVVGDTEMCLWPLGSNVTALREFTALCRIESIPLRQFLIGQDLVENKSKGSSDNKMHEKERPKSKQSMIHAMGGVTALGKGFTQYAKNKFNPSQLEAISASAQEYGQGGFTLIKGPPGTGKTTTLVAVLNSLHIRQFNAYYEQVRKIAGMRTTGNRRVALNAAVACKPRLLVCAPSNAAVDNVILKIMQEGFRDGSGSRYNPSMIRVGVGQSAAVQDVALSSQVDSILAENVDLARLESSVATYKMELQRIQSDIVRLRLRLNALEKASPWPLSKDWEIRIDEENFEQTGRVYFVNHKEKITTFEVPPPPEPGETQFEAKAMPEYKSHISQVIKLVELYNSITTKLERCTIIQGTSGKSGGRADSIQVRQQLETHILDSVHIVMTTLGTAGNRVLEAAAKFEVVVVDEAAQSVEPATLAALSLGSRHSILVGDPQQLPATIFNVSGRNTKYDRSLFQRLEEAGQKVYLLNTQYRMHPSISHFPRRIFYEGNLLDGPNVMHPEYGNPLKRTVLTKIRAFQPFTILDLDSKEERGGTSLANKAEALMAVHLYASLRELTNGLSAQSRVAVITPYAQQTNLLRRQFSDFLGPQYTKLVEINTVDGFQGREANIVIFSCVRAAGSHGIGFLSDVRRMNVALTRAKHFLFVIARCQSIVVNPYWRDLVDHARKTGAVVPVHLTLPLGLNSFPPLPSLQAKHPAPQKPKAVDPRKRKTTSQSTGEGKVELTDPRKRHRSD